MRDSFQQPGVGEAVKLLVVEDHALVREGLVGALRRMSSNVEVLEARDAESALRLIEQNDDLDLLLLDLMLPGINGFSLLGVLRKRFPTLPVVVVSALEDHDSLRRAFRHGASGFVPKSSSIADLEAVVRTVLEGGVYMPGPLGKSGPAAGGRGMTLAERFGLTVAQNRVLELVAQGKSNREIGELLGLAEGTVKVHMSAIFRALGVQSRAQAMVIINRHRGKL